MRILQRAVLNRKEQKELDGDIERLEAQVGGQV